MCSYDSWKNNVKLFKLQNNYLFKILLSYNLQQDSVDPDENMQG